MILTNQIGMLLSKEHIDFGKKKNSNSFFINNQSNEKKELFWFIAYIVRSMK